MAISHDPPTAPPQGEAQAPVQEQAWGRAQAAWSAGAALPWLHREVAQRMADRLSVIRSEPPVLLEWHALAGQSRSVLQAAYPQAQWVAVERGPGALRRLQDSGSFCEPREPQAAPTPPTAGVMQRLGAWARGLLEPKPPNLPSAPTPTKPSAAASAHPPSVRPTRFLEGQVPPAHGQLLWSNMGLHTHSQPLSLLRQWHAALAVDGFLMFSTFGPDTLRELSTVWKEAGWGPAAQPFRDMHDWGDDLVAAGFADPVMDQEVITLTWADAESALAELRTMGRNAHPTRQAGCRTPRWRAQMKAALQAMAGPDGRIPLTFEIIYGHAFRPPARLRVEPVVAVELDEMRRMVQTARRPV